MEQLIALLAVKEVSQTLTPTILELNEDLNQFDVVLQLRVHDFDVLVVLAQQVFKVIEGFLDSFGKVSYSF